MPTFGLTTQGADNFPVSDDRALVTRFELTEAADVTEIAMWFSDDTTVGANARLIIHNDNAGEPGTLAYATSAAPIPAGGAAPLAIAVGAGVLSLTPGFYWLGYVGDGYTARHAQSNGSGTTRMMNGTYNYFSPPADWDRAGDNPYTNTLSAYATYTAASSGVTGSGGVIGDASVAGSGAATATGSGGVTSTGSVAGSGASTATGSGGVTGDASAAGAGSQSAPGSGGVVADDGTATGSGVASNQGSGGVVGDSTVAGSEGFTDNTASGGVVGDGSVAGSGAASNVGSGGVAGDASVAGVGGADDTNQASGGVVADDSTVSGAGAASNVGAGAVSGDATAGGAAVAVNAGAGTVTTSDAVASGTGGQYGEDLTGIRVNFPGLTRKIHFNAPNTRIFF